MDSSDVIRQILTRRHKDWPPKELDGTEDGQNALLNSTLVCGESALGKREYFEWLIYLSLITEHDSIALRCFERLVSIVRSEHLQTYIAFLAISSRSYPVIQKSIAYFLDLFEESVILYGSASIDEMDFKKNEAANFMVMIAKFTQLQFASMIIDVLREHKRPHQLARIAKGTSNQEIAVLAIDAMISLNLEENQLFDLLDLIRGMTTLNDIKELIDEIIGFNNFD